MLKLLKKVFGKSENPPTKVSKPPVGCCGVHGCSDTKEVKKVETEESKKARPL